MAKRQTTARKKVPKVSIIRPKGRPFAAKYIDPDTGRVVRIS